MLTWFNSVMKDGLLENKAVILHGVPPSTLKDQLSSNTQEEVWSLTLHDQ